MSDFRLGQHEEAINKLQADMTQVLGSVQRIEMTLAVKTGERKAASWIIATLSGGTTAAVVTALFRMFGKH